MQYLDDRIFDANKDEFDVEPLTGHHERFERKLDKERERRKQVRLMYLWRSVAAIVLVGLSVSLVRTYLPGDNAGQVTLSSVSEEYREAEFYYVSAVNRRLEELERLAQNKPQKEAERLSLYAQMKEFDETLACLQKELQATPDDERIVNAMLEVYRTKLSIVTMIVDKLEVIKKQIIYI